MFYRLLSSITLVTVIKLQKKIRVIPYFTFQGKSNSITVTKYLVTNYTQHGLAAI